MTVVGLLSPGDMGSAVARVLVDGGASVVANLADRSDRTRSLGLASGVDDLRSDVSVVATADVLLSILVPSQALPTAQRMAAVVKSVGRSVPFVDANAISPATARSMAEVITQAGGVFVDAGIIGPPPRQPGVTRFYTSGPDVSPLTRLADHGLDVRVVGPEVGQASAVKMTYAALTKGSTLLAAALLTAAQRLGVYETLIEEFELSQAGRLAELERAIPFTAPKAHRWEGEMHEIAETLASVGLPDGFHRAAADMCGLIASTPAGRESPEDRLARTLAQAIAEYGEATNPTGLGDPSGLG